MTVKYDVATTVNKKRLDSWKAVADYLDRSQRTVQRWHEFNSLPVHHYGGHKGAVFAFEGEIDNWLTGLTDKSWTLQSRPDDRFRQDKQASNETTMAVDRMWHTHSERNIQSIASLYRQAIDQDSGNAAAFAGLANTLIFCVLNDIIDGTIAYPSAMDALRRTAQLDSEHLEAKCAAAWIDMLHNREWRQARAGFEEVLRRRPSSFARSGLALLQIVDGDIQGAQISAWVDLALRMRIS